MRSREVTTTCQNTVDGLQTEGGRIEATAATSGQAVPETKSPKTPC